MWKYKKNNNNSVRKNARANLSENRNKLLQRRVDRVTIMYLYQVNVKGVMRLFGVRVNTRSLSRNCGWK